MDTTAKQRVVIIGAGAIGCAIARRLAPHFTVTVLEAEAAPGTVSSSRNSGVIHSGMHLPPDFLKAKFAREGSARMAEYVAQHNIQHRACGMLLVAAPESIRELPEELHGFWRVWKRARKQNLNAQLLGPAGVKKLEPNVKAWAGIFAPNVMVIDQRGYINALVSEATAAGAEFVYNAKVTAVHQADTYTLSWPGGTIEADIVINCAGLYTNQISILCGGPDVPVYFYRGEYYEIKDATAKLVSRLVYPAYHAKSAGLGIHITPTFDGRLLLGPSAKRVERPDDYESNKLPAEDFRRAVLQFFPAIKNAQLEWAFSGIRTKLSGDGTEMDFYIKLERTGPTLVNVIGIESPGLTASLPLADHVAALLG